MNPCKTVSKVLARHVDPSRVGWARTAAYLLCSLLLLPATQGTAALPVATRTNIDEAERIAALLQVQVDRWNDGDIPGFMETYWKSDELTFSSGGQTTRGWQATLERYQRRYSTREKMGQLTFDEIEVTMLGDNAAFVLGRWELDRREESMQGNFSLVLRRFSSGWKIVHDHSSSEED